VTRPTTLQVVRLLLIASIEDMVPREPDPDRVIETPTGRAFLDEHEVVRFVCDHGAVIDESAAVVNTDAIVAIAAGGTYPLVVDIRSVERIDAAARRYHATVSGLHFTAVALLVDSPLSRVIGNFFLGLNRPAYALQIFSDESAAIGWLKGAGS